MPSPRDDAAARPKSCARYPKHSKKAPATFPRARSGNKSNQNTLTQVDFVRAFRRSPVPDSQDEDEGDDADERQVDTENSWESPQPKKKRKTTRSASKRNTIGESQRTLTQMPGFLCQDSEDEPDIYISDLDDAVSAAAPGEASLTRPEPVKTEERPTKIELADDENPFLRPVEVVPSSQRSQDESLETAEGAANPGASDSGGQAIEAEDALQQDEICIHEDATAGARSASKSPVNQESFTTNPATPSKPRRSEIPSSQSPAGTPLVRGRSPSVRAPRVPLQELSIADVIRRDEQILNTPTKPRQPSNSMSPPDQENVEPEMPFPHVKETPTRMSPIRSKSSPLKNQLHNDSPFEPSQVRDMRRRFNRSPSPSPRRVHSLGSSQMVAPLQYSASTGNSPLPSSRGVFDGLVGDGAPVFSPAKQRESGATPETSFSTHKSKASPAAMKQPAQPVSRSLRRSESFHTAPESGSQPVRLALSEFESIPPPCTLASEDYTPAPGELLTMTQLLAEEE